MKNLLFISLVLVSCSPREDKTSVKDNKSSCSTMEALDGRDAALVVGDSISMAYMTQMKTEFPDLQVIHNTCNGQSSDHGRNNIDAWASHTPNWKFCTINHGIWDVITDHNVPIDRYVSNLRYEVEHLKTVCETVVFATTTRVPDNHRRAHLAGNIDVYNDAAVELMTELEVPVCDLNAVSQTISHLMVNADKQNDVHYTEAGSEVLGHALAECIRE